MRTKATPTKIDLEARRAHRLAQQRTTMKLLRQSRMAFIRALPEIIKNLRNKKDKAELIARIEELWPSKNKPSNSA